MDTTKHTANRNLRNARGWPMHSPELYSALGLNNKQHLPADGLDPQMVGNVKVWVIPRTYAQDLARMEGRRFVHRVMCECPVCGAVVPAGRLQQHIGADTCVVRAPDGTHTTGVQTLNAPDGAA